MATDMDVRWQIEALAAELEDRAREMSNGGATEN
jgi:hypothetical protein